MTFSDLGLIQPILKAVEDEGYTTPTPIQQQAIPLVLERNDLLGVAQTGTGKTAAFAIPMLQLLSEDRFSTKGYRPIRALIMTPTRELAIQIDESFAAYGRNLPLRHAVIFGGVGQKPQTDALKAGVDILVATPGRLLDLMNQGFISLKSLQLFVLDEADRMLDMGFIHDVKKVIAKLPTQRQSLFFSATMPPDVAKLADTILVKPEKVEVTPVSSTADTIQQTVYFVSKEDKRKLLTHVLADKAIESVLVFTRTKHGADKVVKDLLKAGIQAEAIHGNKSQNARQRALTNFKTRQTRVLVATDIAARGIDVDSLSHVINYEIPNIPETYVHRIGRTGRAGKDGMAVSFCDDEETAYLRDIYKLIGKTVPVVEDHPYVLEGAAEAVHKSGHQPAKKPQPNGQRGSRPQRGPSAAERQPRQANDARRADARRSDARHSDARHSDRSAGAEPARGQRSDSNNPARPAQNATRQGDARGGNQHSRNNRPGKPAQRNTNEEKPRRQGNQRFLDLGRRGGDDFSY